MDLIAAGNKLQKSATAWTSLSLVPRALGQLEVMGLSLTFNKAYVACQPQGRAKSSHDGCQALQSLSSWRRRTPGVTKGASEHQSETCGILWILGV